MKPILPSSRERGRPREFDIDIALDRAIVYFREHGYHGVSIADLTTALQLSAGSIYKAFHSKHALFSSALARYTKVRGAKLAEITNSSASGREKLRRILTFYAESSHSGQGRQGCLVIVGAVELASTDAEIAEQVSRSMAHNEQRLQGLIRLGQNDGSIARTVDVDVTARLMLALVHGLRVLGKTGRQRDDMLAVVAMAMKLLD